ncbi:MAG: hypothetical protein K6A67_10585 [Bacteroidales bacterium]|nr:hypothetical protein [Bacteroidales bacterium]
MENITIGINQRIPIHVLELALCAALQNEASPEYFNELAATEYKGENRIKKTVLIINKLTIRNPLFEYLQKNTETVLAAMKNRHDRPLLFGAIICAAYPFGFDTLSMMGKYFHVQQQVNASLITQRMASKYGSNRSLTNALYCVLPMFIEAGLLNRPVVGIYEAIRQNRYGEFVFTLYRKAFVINNPTYTMDDDIDSNPFFEFITRNYL